MDAGKKKTWLWVLSLLVIAVTTLVWSVSSVFGITLPDMAVRVMGILELIAIPVLVYTSIKRRKHD